jgi:AcrR family transcriptional regulator
MRADGQQNRQRLLDAAEELFSRRGTSVSVAEIVAMAGVGPPTLYRHFGDKEGLIKAIGQRTSEQSMARLARALTSSSGWEGLRLAVLDSVDLARNNTALREGSGVAIAPALERMLLSGWEELVARGHREGSLRKDFTATDVPILFAAASAAAAAVKYTPALVDRYIALLMDGVRPSQPLLPGRAPTPAELRKGLSRATDR